MNRLTCTLISNRSLIIEKLEVIEKNYFELSNSIDVSMKS